MHHLLTLVLIPLVDHAFMPGPANSRDEALDEYVEFLQHRDTSPVDYVLELFDEHDVVVLCERAHPELTQYDLIHRIISDERFLDRVGHVYTEIGTSALRPRVETYLTKDRRADDDADQELLGILRDLDWGSPVYVRPNYHHFLRRIQQLNRGLPQARKVHVYPSDLFFDWASMTAEKYGEFRKSLRERDRLIAAQVVDGLNEVRKRQGARKKALVIMNYRHAFGHLSISRGGRTKTFENVGGFLKAAYPGKVANVMLNSFRALPGSTDAAAGISTIHGGRWDAAFALTGDRAVGFDFVGTPFGAVDFDFFPVRSGLSYQDVFTGFVFYEPLSRHRMALGIPGLVDAPFLGELRRRYAILRPDLTEEQVQQAIDELASEREFDYDHRALFPRSDLKETIAQWLD